MFLQDYHRIPPVSFSKLSSTSPNCYYHYRTSPLGFFYEFFSFRKNDSFLSIANKYFSIDKNKGPLRIDKNTFAFFGMNSLKTYTRGMKRSTR